MRVASLATSSGPGDRAGQSRRTLELLPFIYLLFMIERLIWLGSRLRFIADASAAQMPIKSLR